jgi:hypothetical protein
MAPKIALRSNLDSVDGVTLPGLPRMAKTLCDVARENGWEARVGWSLVAVPEGYRESNQHKAAPTAYLMDVCGVWLAAYRTRACMTWQLAGPGAPPSASGSQGGYLQLPGRFVTLGVEALINYIRGEVGLDEIGTT